MNHQNNEPCRTTHPQEAMIYYLKAIPKRLGGELAGECGNIWWAADVSTILTDGPAFAEAIGINIRRRGANGWTGVLDTSSGKRRQKVTYRASRCTSLEGEVIFFEYYRK